MYRIYAFNKIRANEAVLGWDNEKKYFLVISYTMQERGTYPAVYKVVECDIAAYTPYADIQDITVSGAASFNHNAGSTAQPFTMSVNTAGKIAAFSAQYPESTDLTAAAITYSISTATGNWSGTITAADITRRASGADPVTAWTINGRSAGFDTLVFGDDISFSFSPKNTEYTYKLSYNITPGSATAATRTLKEHITNSETQFTETIPIERLNDLAGNAATGTAAFTLSTFAGDIIDGSTEAADIVNKYMYIGSSTKKAKIMPPLYARPTISSVEITEAATLPAIITFFVQRYSRLRIQTESSAKYGADIQSIGVKIDGIGNYSGADVTTDPVQASGDVNITVTVEDSRGLTASEIYQIEIIPYDPPLITGAQLYRCAAADDQTADPAGAYACIIPAGRVSDLLMQNLYTCEVYYKKTTDINYQSDYIAITTDPVLDTEYTIFSADTGAAYNVYVKITDILSNTVIYNLAPLPAAGALIEIKKDRETIGIFQRAPSGVPGLHIRGNVYLTGRQYENDTVTPLALSAAFQDAAPVQITAASTAAALYIPLQTFECGENILTLCIEASTGDFGLYKYNTVTQTGSIRAL